MRHPAPTSSGGREGHAKADRGHADRRPCALGGDSKSHRRDRIRPIRQVHQPCSLQSASPDNEDEDEGRPVSGDATNITAEDIGSPSIKDRREIQLRVPSIYGVDAYNLLKLATQAFLLFETGVAVARPRNPDTGAPVGNPTDVVPGEEGRIGEQVTFDQIQRRLETYLQVRFRVEGDFQGGLLLEVKGVNDWF